MIKTLFELRYYEHEFSSLEELYFSEEDFIDEDDYLDEEYITDLDVFVNTYGMNIYELPRSEEQDAAD